MSDVHVGHCRNAGVFTKTNEIRLLAKWLVDIYPAGAGIDQNQPCNLPDLSGTNQNHSVRSVGKWNQPLSIKAAFCW